MRIGYLTLLTVIGAAPGIREDDTSDLQTRIELAATDGISAAEFEALADEALAIATRASGRSEFWRAASVVAMLCEAGPPKEARAVRERALGLLIERESDTMRWSSLITRQFLPAFSKIPRESFAAEIDAYDRTLDDLIARAPGDRVISELLYAKIYARVFIDRRWDWLSDDDRKETLAGLGALIQRFGEERHPGGHDPVTGTVGARALQHVYELTHLRFGAPAPATGGVDLDGAPIDISEYAGKVVVIDFWTTFCQPCLALVPGVRAMMTEFEGKPVVYLGVSGDSDREQGKATAARVGMTWRNLWDGPDGPDGPAARAWNVAALGWPIVFIIDRDRRIRFKLTGKDRIEEELATAIRKVLAE